MRGGSEGAREGLGREARRGGDRAAGRARRSHSRPALAPPPAAAAGQPGLAGRGTNQRAGVLGG